MNTVQSPRKRIVINSTYVYQVYIIGQLALYIEHLGVPEKVSGSNPLLPTSFDTLFEKN